MSTVLYLGQTDNEYIMKHFVLTIFETIHLIQYTTLSWE